MESALFFIVIIALGCILYATSLTKPPVKKEAFQDLAVPLAGPPETPLETGDGSAFAPPTTALPAAPMGQTASVNTYPDEDPAMKKASAGRIQSLYTSVDEFLKRESEGLQQLGDPSVQLPLSTARSDSGRLADELEVLKRNPGLESTLTEEDLNGIEANLNYLKQKWRLSANSLSDGITEADLEEGFIAEKAPLSKWLQGPSLEGFQSVAPAPAPGPATSATSEAITLNDLKDLSNRIDIEIVRLNASGTTNTLIQNRITVLQNIRKAINDLITAVENGQKKLSEIPLTKTDIARFLPIMSNLNSPIPAVINQLNAPNTLNNLFQSYDGNDVDAKKIAQQLFDKYSEDILRNLSWNVSLSYTGQAEQDIASNYKAAMADARAFASSDTPGVATDEESAYRGMFDAVVRNTAGAMGPGGRASALLRRTAGLRSGGAPAPAGALGAGGLGAGGLMGAERGPRGAGAGPSQYDWKPRAQQICQQIAARGYNPQEFGCLADPNSVSGGFSWRGYARMICHRLGTIYEPGVPEACGCPPPNWAGWKP